MGKVFVPHGDSAQETAVLLLAEAEDQGLPADVVSSTDGGFVVDEEIAENAGVDYDADASSSDEHARTEAAAAEADDEADEKPKAAKKTAAKKTAKKS